jgi:hypothetical protein
MYGGDQPVDEHQSDQYPGIRHKGKGILPSQIGQDRDDQTDKNIQNRIDKAGLIG